MLTELRPYVKSAVGTRGAKAATRRTFFFMFHLQHRNSSIPNKIEHKGSKGPIYLLETWFWYKFESSTPYKNVRSISKHIAWLCLLLTFGSAVSFATHHHSSTSEAIKCTACIAAHSSVPTASSHQPNVIFAPVAILRPRPVSAKKRLVAFALSVRPPPAI